ALVLLNEDADKLRVVYTHQNNGGNILYKESPISSISLSSPATLISVTYDNSTSTKDNFTTEVVILASNSSQAVGVLAIDGDAPPPTPIPNLEFPVNGYTNVATNLTLSWKDFIGANSYRIQVSDVPEFNYIVYDQSGLTSTSVEIPGLANGTTYYWRVMSTHSGGDTNWSAAWSFKTTSASPTATMVAHWKMDEGNGSLVSDGSEFQNHSNTIGDPSWVEGMDGQALRFSGSQYVFIKDNTSLNITEAITLATWIKPEKRASQYLIKKAEQNGID